MPSLASLSRPAASEPAVGRAPRLGPVIAGVLALGAVLLAALLALATSAVAAPASLQVTPSTVAAGRAVTVTGHCGNNTSGYVISRAFFRDATHDFAGVGAVSFNTDAAGAFTTHPVIAATTAPGDYTIGARCGGGNLGIQVHLTVIAATGATPTAVPAGTGGLAATADRGPAGALIVGGLGALLLLAAGAKLLWSQRPAGGEHR